MQGKILVVDDDKSIRDLLTKAFGEKGYTVKTAESGEAALEILKNGNFQLQFLDLQLPGMNGIELCRRIREDNPAAVLIAMTGYVSVFHLVECRDAGFDDYFVKPFNVQVLLKAAEDAFEKIERWRRCQ